MTASRRSSRSAVAGERPQVHQREQIFRIAGVEAIEIGDLSNVMPDLEAKVPQRMQAAP